MHSSAANHRESCCLGALVDIPSGHHSPGEPSSVRSCELIIKSQLVPAKLSWEQNVTKYNFVGVSKQSVSVYTA